MQVIEIARTISTMALKTNNTTHRSTSAFHNMAASREEGKTVKPMGLMLIYLLMMVIISVFILMIQMHVVDNHVVEISSLSSSPFSVIHNSLDLPERPSTTNKTQVSGSCEDIDDPDEELKPILKILCRGGYDISENSKEVDRSLLPKWSNIMAAYGPPRIFGLETCPIYRNKVHPSKRLVAPAGMFNTGTNLLHTLILSNCDFSNLHDRKMIYQVPWGKHVPFRYVAEHKSPSKRFEHVDSSDTLAIVMVRDPYTWMQSMCLQPYGARYDHDKSRCPNIVPYKSDIEAHPRYGKMKYIPVRVQYDKTRLKYDSMGHLWSEWYLDYIKFQADNKTMVSPVDFPFLMLRMEDLVFHAETVIPIMCECGGGKMKEGGIKQTSTIANGYNHAVNTSSGINSGLIRSVIKYGNITRRRKGYPDFQLQAAKEVLDPRLMELLGYSYEEPSE